MKKHVPLQELISFLQQPSHYPHQPEEVQLIQTHASVLAMAPPYVYKFKKPFDFGFMDFRTLKARKENSERELVLNRRLCKEVYLAVLPLYRHQQQLSFREEGEVVDYALQMKLLPDGFFLHQRLEKGELTKELLEKVLLVLKEFYETQPPRPDIRTYADIPRLKENAEENFESLRQLPESISSPEAIESIQREAGAFLRNRQALLKKRMQEDKIKDCHGDLHLDHIHIRNDMVCIFDCLEFNDRFRYSDIAADIAFLAMDLDYKGRPDLGTFVAERIAELLEDRDMLLLMDYYKNYRACVRAKVEGIKSRQEEIDADEQEQSREKARKYLQLALRYSLLGSHPWLLIVCGKVGSGKSTIAQGLARQLGLSYLSSDICRKKSAGQDLYERTEGERRSQLYGEEQTKKVYRQLLSQSLALLEKQQSVVVDATFSKKEQRAAFVEALEQHAFAYCFIETQLPDRLIKERLSRREEEAAISDARLEDFQKLSRSYAPLTEIAADRHIRLSTEESPEETTEKLLKALGTGDGRWET